MMMPGTLSAIYIDGYEQPVLYFVFTSVQQQVYHKIHNFVISLQYLYYNNETVICDGEMYRNYMRDICK